MPPVFAAIAAAGTWIAATAATATVALTGSAAIGAMVGNTLLALGSSSFLITTGVSLIAGRLNKGSGGTQPAADRIDQGSELKLKLDPSMPRQIPVGWTATGGSLVWAYTYTDDVKVPNKYLVRVISLSDFPVGGLYGVRENDIWLTFTGDPGSAMVPNTHHVSKTGEPRMWIRFHAGSFNPTADPFLVSTSGGQWTANHKGVGQAYVVVVYQYDADAFPQGEPNLTWALLGAKVYDDRKDGSKPGRTGAHRLNDPSTWEYSDNTALIIAQSLRGFYINDKIVIGVQADEEDLSDANLVAAYNTCDIAIDTLGTPEAQYRAGMVLTSTEDAVSYLTDLQAAMDGNIFDRGGQISLLPGGTRTPTLDLTDGNIVWTAERSYQEKSDLSNLYNFVTGTYVSAVDGFIEKPFPPRSSAVFEEEDGGERLTRQLSYRAVVHGTQAQRTSARVHKASRWQATVGFVLPIQALELEQGDWFTLTSERWDFSLKYFEVADITLTEDFRIVVIGKEVHPTIDEWEPVDEEVPGTDDFYTNTPAGLIVPELQVTSTTIANSDNSLVLPAIHVEVLNIVEDGPATMLDYEYAYFVGVVLTNARRLPSKSASIHSFDIQEGVIPNLNYAIRSRSTDGRRYSAWSTWYTLTTPNVYTVPNANKLGHFTSEEIISQAVDAVGAGEAALAEARKLALASLRNSVNAIRDRSAMVDRTSFEQLPVKDVISVMGILSGDKESFIWNKDNLVIDPVTGETMAQRLTTIQVSDQDIIAQVALEATARINADIAEATLRQAVGVTASNAAAAVVTEANARITSDTSFAQWQNLVGAFNGSRTAVILNQNTVQVSAGQTFASMLSGLVTADSTNANNHNSFRQSVNSTLSTHDGHIGALINWNTSLESTINGHSVSINSFNEITNGLNARAGLVINNNGHISGWILNSGATWSDFAIMATSFRIIDPSNTVSITPFAYSGGNIYMAANMYARNIDADVITANMVIGGALANLNGDGTNSDGGATAINCAGGKVIGVAYADIGATSGAQTGVTVAVYRNGSTLVGDGAVFCPGSWGRAGVAIPFDDSPGTGSVYWTVLCSPTSGAGPYVVNKTYVVVLEQRKAG